MNRLNVIEGFRTIIQEMQSEVEEWKGHSDSELQGGVTVDCDWWLDAVKKCNDAYELLIDRTYDYVEWSKQIGVHTCATCDRMDCDCPIENEYALPMDGYCHLWSEKEVK